LTGLLDELGSERGTQIRVDHVDEVVSVMACLSVEVAEGVGYLIEACFFEWTALISLNSYLMSDDPKLKIPFNSSSTKPNLFTSPSNRNNLLWTSIIPANLTIASTTSKELDSRLGVPVFSKHQASVVLPELNRASDEFTGFGR
jgi:hypothetical protein